MLAWLFARAVDGRFRLRIDDLDPATARAEHDAGQAADLAALGLDWDGPVVRQSERRADHEAAIARLVEADLTYPCYCSRREAREAAAAPHGPGPEGAYPGTCRRLSTRERAERATAGGRSALRLRADEARVAVDDRQHGRVEAVVDDFVLRRADGVPAYNLAVVVDDAAQAIGEVVRGDDLLASTPRQVHLARLPGLPVPGYTHVPLVLAPDGRRLAKRDGAVTLADRRGQGEDAAEVRSRLAASLGLAALHEPVTMADLVGRFRPEALPRTPWVLSLGEL